MGALLAHDRQFEDENPQLECQNHVDESKRILLSSPKAPLEKLPSKLN
jgi:hypothetical protein